MFVVDEQSAAEIRRVVEHANSHRFEVESMKTWTSAHTPAIGEAEFCCLVGACRCCYTVENGPVGYVRHLYLWTERGTLPNLEIVTEVAKRFGFHSFDNVGDIASLDECCNTLNLVEPIGH